MRLFQIVTLNDLRIVIYHAFLNTVIYTVHFKPRFYFGNGRSI